MAKTIIAYLGLLAILVSAAISAYLVWIDTSWHQIVAALTAFIAAVGYYLTSPVFSKSAMVDLDAGDVCSRASELSSALIQEGDLAMRLEITLTNRGDPLHDLEITSSSRFAVSLVRSITHDMIEPVSFLDAGDSADLAVQPVRSDDTIVPFTVRFRNRDGRQTLKGRIIFKSQKVEWTS